MTQNLICVGTLSMQTVVPASSEMVMVQTHALEKNATTMGKVAFVLMISVFLQMAITGLTRNVMDQDTVIVGLNQLAVERNVLILLDKKESVLEKMNPLLCSITSPTSSVMWQEIVTVGSNLHALRILNVRSLCMASVLKPVMYLTTNLLTTNVIGVILLLKHAIHQTAPAWSQIVKVMHVMVFV